MSPSLYISFSRSQETEWPPVSLAAVLVLAVLLSVAVVVAACSAVQLWWCSKEEARSASGQVVGPQQREPRCPAMGRWSPVPVPSSRGTVASRVRVGEGRRGERKCEAMGREKTQRKRSHSGQQKNGKKKRDEKEGTEFSHQIATVVWWLCANLHGVRGRGGTLVCGGGQWEGGVLRV